MAFDTSMYGRIDMNTPIRLGQILDPASIQQRKAEQMATQENIAQMQDARTLRDLLSGAPDIQTAASRLAQAGKWKEAGALQSQIQALELGKQKAQQAQQQQAVDQAIYAASIAPTDESFKAVLTAKGIPEEQHAAALASLPKDPEERRALISLTPAKRAELDFQMRKQSEAKAADLARQEARDAAAEKRAAAREDAAERRAATREAAADRRMEMRLASAQGNGGASQKAPQGKPLPIGAVKLQDEILGEIGNSENIKNDVQALTEKIQQGQIKLGPVSNFINSARNAAGASSPESVAYADMKTTMERLRNDSLRLNKGVQTEGDAQREWSALFTSINDPKVVANQLKKIAAINDRAVDLQKSRLNAIRSNYGMPPADYEYESRPSSGLSKKGPYKSKSGAIIELE